jgi:hypothetical protein
LATLGQDEAKNPFKMEVIRATIHELEEKHAQLLHLLESIPRETPPAKNRAENPEAFQKITEGKKKALAALNTTGALK